MFYSVTWIYTHSLFESTLFQTFQPDPRRILLIKKTAAIRNNLVNIFLVLVLSFRIINTNIIQLINPVKSGLPATGIFKSNMYGSADT